MIGVIGRDKPAHAISRQLAVDTVRDALVHLGTGIVIQPPAVEILMPVLV